MKNIKLIDFLIFVATGFTFAHGLLFFLIIFNRQLYEQILYHYSESLTWYFIFFIFPFLAGLSFYFFLKNISISNLTKRIFTIIFSLQILFTGISTILNYNYWGYAFKRPTIFNEISNTYEVLTISKIINIDKFGIRTLYSVIDTTISLKCLQGRNDIYYGIKDRPFLVLQDKLDGSEDFFDVDKIYNDTSKKISFSILKNIENQIYKSNILDFGDNNLTRQLSGIIIEFQTIDSVKYLLVEIRGGQISNDHYPSYEVLFKEINNKYVLENKQRFYTDSAGIEGFEYASIAPFFSLILSIFATLIILIQYIVKKIKIQK